MTMNNDLKPGFVVSDAILTREGMFTVEDIMNSVKEVLSQFFSSSQEILSYITNKLNSMCDFGLIGRTDFYYFSL